MHFSLHGTSKCRAFRAFTLQSLVILSVAQESSFVHCRISFCDVFVLHLAPIENGLIQDLLSYAAVVYLRRYWDEMT